MQAVSSATLRNDIKRDELNKLLEDSLKDTNNVAVDAAEALFTRVRRRSDLYEYVADPLVRTALYDLVRSSLRRKRIRVWDAKVIVNHKTGVQMLARANYSLLNDFTVEGYGPLGDVTYEQLTAAVKFYRDQASNMSGKAYFLSLVLRNVDPGKKVRDCIDEKKARQLRERSRHAK